MNTNKQKLISYYNQTNLPKNLIENDCLKHREFLFSESAQKPTNNTQDLSMAFITEKTKPVAKPGWRNKQDQDQ